MKQEYEKYYSITCEDYHNLNKWFNRKGIRRNIVLLIIVSLLGGGIIILQERDVSILIPIMVVLVILTGAFSLGYYFFLKVRIRKRSEKIYLQDVTLREKYHLLVNEKQVEEKSESTHLVLNWNEFLSVVILEHYIYFMVSRVKMIILPLDREKDGELIEFVKMQAQKNNKLAP